MTAPPRVRLALLASLLLAFLAAAPNELPDELFGKVIGVHDGDTLTLLVDKRSVHKIRLDGIDSPEIGQDFGTQAKKSLSSKVFAKYVRVVTHGKDRYGRVIGTVFLDSSDPPTSVNEQLVAGGWAWHYVKYSDSKALATAETEAREKKVGLWSGPTPTPPWDWRGKPAKSKSAGATSRTAPTPASPSARSDPSKSVPRVAEKFWLNTSSGVRHNAGCRYFGSTKSGRYCSTSEGKACGICGG